MGGGDKAARRNAGRLKMRDLFSVWSPGVIVGTSGGLYNGEKEVTRNEKASGSVCGKRDVLGYGGGVSPLYRGLLHVNRHDGRPGGCAGCGVSIGRPCHPAFLGLSERPDGKEKADAPGALCRQRRRGAAVSSGGFFLEMFFRHLSVRGFFYGAASPL